MRDRGFVCWLTAAALAVMAVTCLQGVRRDAGLWGEEAAAAFAENLFAPPVEEAASTPAASPSPEMEEGAVGFAIEVLGVATPKPAARVLIYHTHTYEAFAQSEDDRYQETEKWRTADPEHNVVRVGEELAGLLRGLGLEVVHDTTAFEPPVLSSAYARSLDMLKARAQAGERFDLYIDLHRDAYIASQKGPNTVSVGGVDMARVMVLIGKGEGASAQGFDEKPDWEKNLALAETITACANSQADGVCREVSVKTGRYNQHVADCCILVEAGNNRNTLPEVLAAMPYLADAIYQALMR